jgi:hypothetical protein
MDFIEERRFELDSDVEEEAGSLSATVKERLRLGERKEFGESDGGRGVGEG